MPAELAPGSRCDSGADGSAAGKSRIVSASSDGIESDYAAAAVVVVVASRAPKRGLATGLASVAVAQPKKAEHGAAG